MTLNCSIKQQLFFIASEAYLFGFSIKIAQLDELAYEVIATREEKSWSICIDIIRYPAIEFRFTRGGGRRFNAARHRSNAQRSETDGLHGVNVA